MTNPVRDDLFERAKGVDLLAIAGGKLFRAGRRWRGPCPVCGASQGKKADGAFWVDPAKGRWGCFAGGAECAEGGDAVALERALRGGTPREAAERMVGDARTAPSPARPAPTAVRPDDGDARKRRFAARSWSEARPAGGTLVEVYLRARGIGGEALRRALGQLRFHPDLFWDRTDDGLVLSGPAMLGLVVTPAGPTGGVHATYLAPDGRSKTARTPAKRMWGPQARDGRPGGVWLCRPDDPGDLVAGEGIESTLSAARLLGDGLVAGDGRPRRVVAALSLDALQGGWLRDPWGRVDPACPRSDPERPAFTWPGVERVAVAVDRDMNPVRVKVRKPGGGTRPIEIDGETRARVCAALACRAWSAGGAQARAIAPGPGRDFNDELRARLAKEAA